MPKVKNRITGIISDLPKKVIDDLIRKGIPLVYTEKVEIKKPDVLSKKGKED